MYNCLSIYLGNLCIYWSIHPSIRLWFYLAIQPKKAKPKFIHRSIKQSPICLFFFLSIYVCIYLLYIFNIHMISIFLTFYIFFSIDIYLSIYLSIIFLLLHWFRFNLSCKLPLMLSLSQFISELEGFWFDFMRVHILQQNNVLRWHITNIFHLKKKLVIVWTGLVWGLERISDNDDETLQLQVKKMSERQTDKQP